MTERSWSERAPDASSHPVGVAIHPSASSAVITGRHWSSQISAEVTRLLHDQATNPDLLTVFISGHDEREYPAIVREIRAQTGAQILIGCSTRGLVAEGHEFETEPGVALMAAWLPGADLHPIRLHQEQVDLLTDPPLWREVTGAPDDPETSWLVIAEAFRLDVQTVIEGLARMYPGQSVVGGLSAGGSVPRRSWIFIDDQLYEEGGVAIAFKPPYRLVPFVSHGCQPVGEAWTITGVERNTVLSISNRPAADVMRETMLALNGEAALPLVAGFAVDEYQDQFVCGDFVVRGILGIDDARGGVVVGGKPRLAQTIQFHQLDPQAADVELHQTLVEAKASVADRQLVAGLLFTCDGRGRNLFGAADHDARAVQRAFGDLPVSGMFCLGEIGPVCGQTQLQAFTATLGLLTWDGL